MSTLADSRCRRRSGSRLPVAFLYNLQVGTSILCTGAGHVTPHLPYKLGRDTYKLGPRADLHVDVGGLEFGDALEEAEGVEAPARHLPAGRRISRRGNFLLVGRAPPPVAHLTRK